MWKHLKDDNGEFAFSDTGDELIDKWEKEISMGITPDLEEGLSRKSKEKLKQERSKSKESKELLGTLGAFSEDYSDPRYRSKLVQPGSEEERKLQQIPEFLGGRD